MPLHLKLKEYDEYRAGNAGAVGWFCHCKPMSSTLLIAQILSPTQSFFVKQFSGQASLQRWRCVLDTRYSKEFEHSYYMDVRAMQCSPSPWRQFQDGCAAPLWLDAPGSW